MALDKEAAKKEIVDFIHKKSKSKSKFYMKDFFGLFPDEKNRDVKKLITEMVQDEVLVYWSSGSSTMIGLKGEGKQAGAEHED
jgi:hypothetical protein